jgi:beta-galactosidase/beta-glucuronidase
MGKRVGCVTFCGSLLFAGAFSAPSKPLTSSRTVTRSSLGGFTSLSLESWTLSGYNDAVGDVSIPANVPGLAHLALLEADILPIDPLYRMQELNYTWVAQTNWTYSTAFPTPTDLVTLMKEMSSTSSHEQVVSSCFLNLDGVDTAATIFFNGVNLGKVNNLFKQHTFDVSALLNSDGTNNTLTIAFQNALMPSRAVKHTHTMYR